MKTQMLLPGLALLAALGACQPRVDPARAAAEIRAADARWLAAAHAHDLEGTLAFWSDDVLLIRPGAPPLVGKQAVRAYVRDAFALPDFAISWVTQQLRVSASGDLAYGTGTDEIRLTTPDGRHVVEHNNAVAIWRRGADGAWRCAVDIWNSAEPAR